MSFELYFDDLLKRTGAKQVAFVSDDHLSCNVGRTSTTSTSPETSSAQSQGPPSLPTRKVSVQRDQGPPSFPSRKVSIEQLTALVKDNKSRKSGSKGSRGKKESSLQGFFQEVAPKYKMLPIEETVASPRSARWSAKPKNPTVKVAAPSKPKHSSSSTLTRRRRR